MDIPVLLPILRGLLVVFACWVWRWQCVFHIWPLLCLVCSLYSHLPESFYHRWVLDFIKCFLQISLSLIIILLQIHPLSGSSLWESKNSHKVVRQNSRSHSIWGLNLLICVMECTKPARRGAGWAFAVPQKPAWHTEAFREGKCSFLPPRIAGNSMESLGDIIITFLQLNFVFFCMLLSSSFPYSLHAFSSCTSVWHS